MSKRDYYDILGVSKGAGKDEIKKAFRKAAVEHHPDKGGEEAKFKEINEAYEVLSDDKKKAAYDQFGHAAGAHQAGGGAGADPFGGFGGGPGGFNVDFDFSGMGGQGGNLNDIFEMFFHGSKNRARDVEIAVTIDFEEAVRGTTKEISLRIMDREKNERKSETVKVKIPAGIDDGQSIRLEGKGEIGAGGTRGNLYVHIRVRPSRDFERQDTRAEADKALADLKAKGMQVNELPAAEANRMREKLAAVNAGIAANVGEALWKEVQGAVAQARAAK